MKAPVLHGRRSMAFDEVPEPEPGPGEVLLSVGLCGICGSDLHLYDSPMAPDGIVMGHEFGATVMSAGAGVEGWRAGDRVVATMPEPCLDCTFCRSGELDMCYQHYRLEGRGTEDSPAETALGSYGYAPLLKMAVQRLLRIPDE
ncbi:MAG: alcohol dehydrogenase catalytic domain-containing protein, partial [Dehalococcoidia bacterium]